MEKMFLEKLYDMLTEAEDAKDEKAVAALRWAIFHLEKMQRY